MSSFKFQKIQTQNQELNRIQDNIQNLANKISGPFIGGINLTGLAVKSASATSFNHGLQRTPEVWVISDQDTLATVKRTAWDLNTITLQSSADCTINVWIN